MWWVVVGEGPSAQVPVNTRVNVPDIGSLFRPKAMLTSRMGYLRLHSRASAQWYIGAAERYDYSYRDEELQALAADWSHLAEGADCIFVFFNNCRHGQAAKNAQRFMEIVCGGPANSPPPS